MTQVLYNAENFLEKNRDKLDINLKKAMINSVNPFISDLFQAEETDTGGISRYRKYHIHPLLIFVIYIGFLCIKTSIKHVIVNKYQYTTTLTYVYV